MRSLTSLVATAALLSSALAASPYSPPQPVRRQSSGGVSCNNSPDLCARTYNSITHLGAHDSSFLRDESTGNSIAGNQNLNATKALDAGFRLLQGQVHPLNGVLHLCHSSCDLLDAGPLTDWLTEIAFWVDNHPNDVITILLVNSDSNAAEEYGASFDAAGLGEYGYVPTGNGWPTLAAMINSGKRVVSFVTNIIDTPSATYPYILDEFTYVFETPFEVTSSSGFNCTLDRPSSAGTAAEAIEAGMLPLLNHFMYQDLGGGIYIPDISEIETTNSADVNQVGSLGLHGTTCTSEWGVQPAFVLVDFWDEGEAIQAADALNQVAIPEGRVEGSAAGGRIDTSGLAMVLGLVAATWLF